MANGPRAGLLALFFVGGMAFMAALFAMVPRDFLSRDAARVITASSPPVAYSQPPENVEELSLPSPVNPDRGEQVNSSLSGDPNALAYATPVVAASPRPTPPANVPLPNSDPPHPVATNPPSSSDPEQRGRLHNRAPGKDGFLGRAEVVRRLKPGRRILGHVVLDGNPPPEKPIQLDEDLAVYFTKQPTTRFFVVGSDHSLADVVVAITAGLPRREWPAVNKPLVISNHRSFIEPYVSAAQTGQQVVFENLDPQLHALRLFGQNNSRQDLVQWPHSEPRTVQFSRAEMFLKIACGAHPWEIGYLSLFDHPYFAVTGPDGRFELEGLPPGRYTLSAAHRKAGVIEKEIEVRYDSSLELEIAFPITEKMAAGGN